MNQTKVGDLTSPLLLATINGHFDLAKVLLDRGADPNLASLNGVTPLYAVLNLQWAAARRPAAPAGAPQSDADRISTCMTALLDQGADPNARLTTRVWYSGGLSGVDEIGSTPFWRAAYASDLDAMKLLVARGADPNIPTVKGVGRPPTDDGQREYTDVSRPPGHPHRRPRRAAAGRRRRASATARASPPTRTTTRPPG